MEALRSLRRSTAGTNRWSLWATKGPLRRPGCWSPRHSRSPQFRSPVGPGKRRPGLHPSPRRFQRRARSACQNHPCRESLRGEKRQAGAGTHGELSAKREEGRGEGWQIYSCRSGNRGTTNQKAGLRIGSISSQSVTNYVRIGPITSL